MSDDRKNVLEGLGDFDWDSALDEWEKKSFVPEVARDADTGTQAKAPGPRPSAGSTATDKSAPAGTQKASEPMLSEKAPEGTLIAPVPRELLDEPATTASSGYRSSAPRAAIPSSRPSMPSVPPAMRGGLDQLFSRTKGATPSKMPPPPSSMPPMARPPIVSPIPAKPSERPSSEERDVAPHARASESKKDPGSVTRQVVAPAIDLSAFADIESEYTRGKGAPLEERNVAASAPSTFGAAQPVPLEALAPDEETAERPTTELARRVAPPTRGEDDSENETVVRDRGSLSDADTADRMPADDEMPTLGRSNMSPGPIPSARGRDRAAAPHAPSAREQPAPELPPVDGERPVSPWLDEEKTRSLLARITWLEEEARAVGDDVARGRALLVVSELCALVGDNDRALVFAMEARDIAPQLPLAWRQVRQLMPRDPEALAATLDAEARRSPTPSARAHATLLAADVLRINGLGDAAVERWESACKLDPADTRAPIARAALALAQDDHTNGALRLADNSELISLDKAIATALRLRGVQRSGAEVDEMPINDGLRHTRAALVAGDVVAAAQAAGEIARLPELSKGALWLSAAFGAAHIASRRAAARALKTLSADETLARRQLASRGIELGDPELVDAALGDEATNSAFEPAERATLHMLATKGEVGVGIADTLCGAATAKALASTEALAPLEDALLSLAPVVARDDDADLAALRAQRVCGKNEARALATLGRLLAANSANVAIDEALGAVTEPRPPTAFGVGIESAVRAKRWAELSDALSRLPGEEGTRVQHHIAAAIVAERGEDRERAKEAWTAVARGDVQHDGILRIAADLDRDFDLGAELLRATEQMPDGIGAAILRLEAIARGVPGDDERAPVLERVHHAAPALGIGAFLGESMARRKGDIDEVLRWIQERRGYAVDPLETALDAVREALLVADRDPELASTRLEEAHHARPDDVALRELYERLAPEPPLDRGTWREKRASALSGGPGAALLWIEAALEHERGGDGTAMLRAARNAAEAGDRGLSRPMIERGELDTGETTAQMDELEAVTKSTEDEGLRREALERLAFLDAFGKKDAAAALRWHRSILETSPRHKPALRWIEHAFIGDGRDDELAPIFEQIALALDGTTGGEVTAHAQHAARLQARHAVASAPQLGVGAWERTHDMARLAATQPEPSLWALRALNAHARSRTDEEAILKTTLSFLERTQRPPERASLLLRASEAAARLEQVADTRAYLEQAANEDPGDVVTWGFLAEVRERTGETRLAAEACESLARTSVVPEHQVLAWHDAAKIWLDEVKDTERAMIALEAAAEIDVTYADVFPRLSALYADRRLDAELARLLEKRLGTISDDDERVGLEVELAHAFAEMGELGKAKSSLQSALEKRPDHTTALGAMGDLCAKEGDWNGAEQAYVRLARLLPDPAEQRAVYERLGEIYAVHAPNLSRAETAFKEVLKRAPDDLGTLAKLVDVYRRQGNVQRAAETQQEIVSASTDPAARLGALVDLARIYEVVGRDPRKSEQVLDSARKEFPTSVVALRAMAEFYARQRQMPAMQILLDRAAGDARRAFAQGRFVPSLFQVLHAAFELRGKRDAARVVAATLAAVEGHNSDLMGAEARAVDPRLDDLLAPDAMSPPLRALLFRTGDALDAVAPVDLRALKATPLQPGTPIGATVGSVATVIGLGALQILVSPTLGRVALPLATNPPTLLVGEGLAKVKNERARMFVVVRAMKMILARASALLRGTMGSPGETASVKAQEISSLVAGLFCAFNPSYVPQNIEMARVTELARRIGPALPRSLDPTVGVIALEAAGMVGTQWSTLGPAAATWANRVALLAVGDPNAALDALAWGHDEDAAPTGAEERAAWIARHPEARELMTFSVTDTYAEARVRLGLDR